MDIVMLGHSQAGKTSYMAAMYDTMVAGVGGFTVKAERPEDHRALIRNARRLQAGTFPAASDRRTIYQLGLLHEGSPVLDFVWRDYRGGALTEKSDSPQAIQLREDVAKAGGLVLMIDSTELIGGLRSMARVRPLVATAIRLLGERRDVLPLVIALTKWDLVRATEAKTQRAADEAFGSLIAAVRGDQHVLGALVPVACGRQPLNVVQPVLWCLHVGIAVRGILLQQSIERQEQAARAAHSRDTLWDRVKSKFTGEPTWAEIAVNNMVGAYEDAQRLQPLIIPSQRLESMLDSVEKF